MTRVLYILPIFFILVFSYSSSQATVLVEDVGSQVQANNNGFGEAEIGIQDGVSGQYGIFSCSVPNNLGNVFNPPAPGVWTELDQGACANGGTRCRHGIWAGFIDTPNSVFIDCSWTEFGTVFAAGSIRYNDVDRANPIIDIACSSGEGPLATAPSIITEAGSQVLRVYTASLLTFTTNFTNPAIASRLFESGEWNSGAVSDGANMFNLGSSELAELAGPTGTASISGSDIDDFPTNIPFEWRACTIGIRMAKREVPTMSEWGLIGFAAFAGIAGVWYLRRRQLAA